SLKTSIKTITNLSDTNCLEIQGASLKNDFDQNDHVILSIQLFHIITALIISLLPLFSLAMINTAHKIASG
ncbi:hypothetical protein, partial [Yersinia intermedia]|uniref:hypothetical protein n=1 Tax=Yersinia intermedia TaxID=631 RepID=UPI001C94D728